MIDFHLAQLNIARTFASSLEDPVLADFMAQLDAVNALADSSPGFVWRLQDESGNATGIDGYDDPKVIVNMSVWESAEALFEFTYKTAHAKVLARRADWFEKFDGPHMVLWWVPAGHRPTIEEARECLDRLVAHGPSPECFTFRQRHPAPAVAA